MTISYNWLKNYLKTDLSPEQLAVILTDIGLEVDRFEKCEGVPGGLEGVVVGEVLTCEKHADADRLSVTRVDIGTGDHLQIVCGAPNVAQGQKVLVATVNTTLYPKGEPEGFKIKKSKIRGVESLGMICAEDELGIGTDHTGIMVLDDSAVPGTPAREVIGLEDNYIIEIGLTPNRIDAASHFGVARDLAAYLRTNGIPCELHLPTVADFSQDIDGREVTVQVEDHDGAPRYCGVTITDIKIAPSPEWLQTYLRDIGINPKNNVVDITNFVLHEVGQPLHAFDADKVAGDKIVVRTCPEGTKFTTLDEVERTLASDDLMICSAREPMCLAGIFGGLDSGVSENTTSVFLESAYFNPSRVRRSARRHGLNTDSSFRFERGADPNMNIYALKRAALLISELAGGKISSPVTDIYPEKIAHFRFDISLDRLNTMANKVIPVDTVTKIIEALEINIEALNGETLSVAVPPFRVDVCREADLFEEILRIYGYNNIEIPTKVNSALSYAPKPDKEKLVNMAADHLTALGYAEIMSNSLTSSAYYEQLESYPVSKSVKILNPLSTDLDVMRQTLLFGILESVNLNINHRNPDLKVYEFGNTYHFDGETQKEDILAKYREDHCLAMAITGNANVKNWNNNSEKSDYFVLSAAVSGLLKRFGIEMCDLPYQQISNDIFREGISYKLNGKELLSMGIVSPTITGRFDIKQDVYFMEMNFNLLVRSTRNNSTTVEALSKYPEVRRDLSILVDKTVTFAELRKAAFSAEKKLLTKVSLFDYYQGDKLPEGKKSYALSFILEDRTKTLTEQIIERTMNNIATALERTCGAVVRS